MPRKKIGITKREAIRECKRLWKAIKKSGMSKLDFLTDTPKGGKWAKKNYWSDCPLCEYAKCHPARGRKDCPCFQLSSCPLVVQLGKDCFELGYHSQNTLVDTFLKAVMSLKE